MLAEGAMDGAHGAAAHRVDLRQVEGAPLHHALGEPGQGAQPVAYLEAQGPVESTTNPSSRQT